MSIRGRIGRACAGLLVASLTGFSGGAAQAQISNLGPEERAVLLALNVCWTAELQGNFPGYARSNGFEVAPQATGLYVTKAMHSSVFLGGDFGAGSDGQPEPACRVTVLKPTVDSDFVADGAVLPRGNALLNYMIQQAPTLGPGYQVVYQRQAHPRRPGRTRTLLRSDQGARVRLIYVEQGREDYEFLYAHGSRAAMMDPSITDVGTDPRGRTNMQAYVNDAWEIAFCDLNPHQCLTRAQVEAMQREAEARARASREPIPIPFSGIGQSAGGNTSHADRLRREASDQDRWRCERWRREGASIQCHQ